MAYDYAIDDLNITSGDSTTRGRHFIWWVKDFLTRGSHAATWTVEGSSDSVTGSLDASDRWTTSFVEAKLVEDAPGSPHSWMVLKSAATIDGAYWYLLIDYNENGWWERCSWELSDAAYTGGDASNAPTTTGNTYTWLNNPLSSNYSGVGYCHGVINDDGTFWVGYSETSGGVFNTVFFMLLVDNQRANDTSSSVVAYKEEGSGSSIATTPQDDVWMQDNDGSLQTTGSIEPYRFDTSASALRSSMTAVDIVESKYVRWPLWLMLSSESLGGHSIKGKMVDVTIPIGTTGQGDTYDASGTITHVAIGPNWLPADVAPTL